MRQFVIGDIHGMYDKLKACLEKVNFDYNEDKLVLLGDICDRGGFSWEVVEELLKIRKRISVRGNHDEWFASYLKNDVLTDDLKLYWLPQGGLETVLAYELNEWKNLDNHKKFYSEQLRYYVEDDRLFVHAGIELGVPMKRQINEYLYWDRGFVKKIFGKYQIEKFSTHENFKEIFIGHTPVGSIHRGVTEPLSRLGVWNLDTGSGKGGVLTLMNIETKEYVQS